MMMMMIMMMKKMEKHRPLTNTGVLYCTIHINRTNNNINNNNNNNIYSFIRSFFHQRRMIFSSYNLHSNYQITNIKD